MVTTEIRQQERIVNNALAELLRDRCDLDAQAEVGVAGRYPDVLVNVLNGPVILETEFAPAYSVRDDAFAKLGLTIRGRSTDITFAVVLPEELKQIHQRHLRERLAIADLEWTTCFSDASYDETRTGDFVALSDDVARAIPKGDDVSAAVQTLEKGALQAGSLLYSSPGTMVRVAEVFEREASDEVANMAALMVINAMVFHNKLSSSLAIIPPPPPDFEYRRKQPS